MRAVHDACHFDASHKPLDCAAMDPCAPTSRPSARRVAVVATALAWMLASTIPALASSAVYKWVDTDGITGEAGGVVNPANVLDGSRHFEATQIGATEADAGVGGRRFQRQSDFLARVQAYARTRD